MRWRLAGVLLYCFGLGQFAVQAQSFTLLGREVEIHGFASQGFVYTDRNNWLTMNTNQGSANLTDFGFTLTTSITGRLRVGAQFYDRDLGHLGNYHPTLDWAVADYRFKNWFGIRGGKVKTVRGLYNDSQDLDFLRPFAFLPQSVYPIDLRDSIAHLGGDIYGNIALHHSLGDFAYTVYAGHRHDSASSGYPYLLTQFGTHFTTYGGLQYGADVRWNTPLKGFLVGASRMNENISGEGTSKVPGNFTGPDIPFSESSKADWTNQYYGEYKIGKLCVDSEYRRYWRNESIFGGAAENLDDVRGWYVSGYYRAMKRLTLGSYYSHYTITSTFGGIFAGMVPDQTDTTLPQNHIYDKALSARVDINKFLNVKVEGHFMNGYGNSTYPNGFYPQVNPGGFSPDTNAFVAKVGFNF